MNDLQERALHYVDAPVGDLKIGEGITLIQSEPQAGHDQSRSLKDIKLPVESEARELEVDTLLVDRLARFLGSHTLQFKVPRDAIEDMQRSLEEGMFMWRSIGEAFFSFERIILLCIL